jgi:phytoene synthase
VKRPRDAHVDPADALAFRAAREVCRRHAGDLYGASAFLPRPKRDAAYAVYAFGRMIRDALGADEDDSFAGAAGLRHRPLGAVRIPHAAAARRPSGMTVGDCCSSNSLDQRFSLFRDRLDELYEGRFELPSPAARSEEQHVLHAFAATARRYQIPRRYFHDLAEGIRKDLTVFRYATWGSLERYCQHAGGAGGAIAGCVFGVTNSDAAEFALQAGRAIRLTGILCDLGSEAAAGRIYLPLEDLAAFRYSERELVAGVVNENFRRLIAFQVARVRRLYREAVDGLCWVAGDGSRLAAATILAWQGGLLDALEKEGYDVFARRPALGAAEKLRRMPLAWRLARRRPDAKASSCSDARHDRRLPAGT